MPTMTLERGCQTILLVEPDRATRKAAAALLSRWGHQVIEACDAPEACRLYAQYGPQVSLLVTEAPMPLINGHELARMLLAQNPGLRVLYISEADYEMLARGPAAAQGLEFLRRPFTVRSLAGKMRRVLSSPAPQAG